MNALDRLESLQVADAMSKRATSVSVADTMDTAARILREQKISAAPVVDEQGTCVGILSATDFLRRNAARGPCSADRVADFMSSDVRTVAAYAPLLLAARMMCDEHIHRVPVIDHHGKVIGVISTLDIVAAQLNAREEMEAGAGYPRYSRRA